MYRYKDGDEVPSKCSYDMDEDTGVAEMHKCEPSGNGLTHLLTYSGTDSEVCQITVSNVEEDANCTWSTRLGDEMGRSCFVYGTFDSESELASIKEKWRNN